LWRCGVHSTRKQTELLQHDEPKELLISPKN